jgi:adenylate cyclase
MAREIERKFLIKKIPADADTFPHQEIVQGYFLDNGNKTTRLRKKWDRYYFQATKSWVWMVREEDEISITPEDFQSQRKKVGDRQLSKLRYEMPYEWKIIELDVYQGKLTWLIVAEIEFTSVDEAKKFIVPDRFDIELTDKEETRNSYLAKHGVVPSVLKLL